MCDFKAAQINTLPSIIQEIILSEFKLSYNSTNVTKKICFAKYKGVVDHNTINRRLKKFQSGRKYLAWSGGFCDYGPSHLVVLSEYQASLVFHSPVWFGIFMFWTKLSGVAELCFTLPKYCETFYSP